MTIAPCVSAGRHRAGGTKLGRLLDWVALCVRRRRQRIALARLSDPVLCDIGLTRIDIEVEANKPFWQP